MMRMRLRSCLGLGLGALLFCGSRSHGADQRVPIRVSSDSEAPGYEAVHAFDGDVSTMWHTRFGAGQTPCPHHLVVDLGRVFPITGMIYVPRSDGGNGSLGKYTLQAAIAPDAWAEPVLAGELRPVPGKPIELPFPAPVEARYLRLTALTEANGNAWASAAEVTFLSPGIVFRTESLPAAAHHGSPAPRRRQGPDTATLAGALDLARQTLALVERAAARPDLARALDAVVAEVKALGAGGEAEPREELRGRVLALRRRILLAHPALAFERLLINQRPPPSFRHQTDQYLGRYSGVGAGLVVLDHWRDAPVATPLLQGKLPPGSVLHPDLSFDGSTILFSYCDHTASEDPNLRRFFIWSIRTDGSGLRQLTGVAHDPMVTVEGRHTVLIEDWDPCWLPDGGFAFVSTRNQGGVRCHHGGRYCPTYMLYRADADGAGIQPLSFGEANEWDPSVLHDGRILWTRWDYINRHDTVYQSLWTTRPDGTGTAHFYGNYTRNPCDITEARAIPGSTKVVATASAHHWYTAGSLIVIDPAGGQDGEAPLTRVTPEAAFPETEGWPTCGFATPWPITEEIFLCAYSEAWEASANSYSIYLVDTLGGRELIYRDPAMSSFCPMPLQPRPRPPILPSTLPVAPAGQTASVYIRNVYDSTQPIPAGTVREVRVARIFPQPVQRVPDRSRVLFEVAKGEVGSAPVAADGSASFAVPAGVPLLLQLVDGDGMAVMGMRTFIYLHAGERLSCSGCHENRRTAPPRLARSVRDFPALVPANGPPEREGLSFARTVQPVLDRRCLECHGLKRQAANLSLLGSLPEQQLELGRVQGSAAYLGLTQRPGLVVAALRNQETPFSRPGDYGARASTLGALLLHGDEDHKPLPTAEFRRVARWLDLNSPFYGDYSWNKDEWRRPDPAGERILRAAIRDRFGTELAEQPFAALVNLACPEESRILMAPLAESAGGWGQIQEKGWQRADDPSFLRLRELVLAAIAPLAVQDREGTCQQTPCQCGACWVPAAEMAYRRAQGRNRPPAD